jgi:putative effector of murein hydrolase LrgA (UPF0299 family)
VSRTDRDREPRKPPRLDEERVKDLFFNAVFALLMTLIALPLTFFPLFEGMPTDWTLVDWGLSLALLGAIWGLALHFFLSCFRRPRAERASRFLIRFALILFAGFLAVVFLKDDSESRVRFPLGETIGAFILFAWAMGLVFYFGDRKRRSLSSPKTEDITRSPLIVLLWPLLMFAKSPLSAMLGFLPILGILYLGQWVGGKWGHPMAGALLSAAGLFAALLATRLLASRKGKGGRGDGEKGNLKSRTDD